MRQQYIWRKQASRAWLQANERDLLTRFGEDTAFIERPGGKRISVEICCVTRHDAAKLAKNFGGRFARISQITSIPQTKPLKVGARLVVTDGSSRISFPNRRHLEIPTSGAFGTGGHATTAMCVRLIEKVTRGWRNDWSMFDAGTGSGILALAARCFGADRLIAIDNDPGAIAIAKSNARLNRIRGIRFEIADARRFRPSRKVDVIAANLFSELLIAALPKWIPRLRSKGILILSGVLRTQEREVMHAVRRERLAIEEIRRRGKWVAILARN